jgi:uncharacterized membrane protein SpoIIM required for sporulation
VNLDAFVERGQPEWTELEALVRRARGRPERLGPDGVLRLGALYRSAIGDLAQGRRQFPGDPAVRGLEQLVGRARATVYAPAQHRGSALSYLTRGYWRAVRRQGPAVLLAWALVLGSTALAMLWAVHDPAAAAGVVPGSLSSGGSAPQHAIGLGAGQSAAISVSIFTNNIGVTFLAFATGIAFGVLPAFVLLYNGVILGAVAGIVAGGGHLSDLIVLIVPHGLLELSCIAVCAAAGMRMGWALVEPGPYSRTAALARRAPQAVLIVLATMPFLIAAGLVEGFVTPRHLPLAAALAVGLGLAVPYWSAVWWLGRPAHDRSVVLARR